jgi:hypothetical protein
LTNPPFEEPRVNHWTEFRVGEEVLSLIHNTEAVKKLRQSGEPGLVLFLGAGVSVEAPSSCPAWNQLLKMVVSAVEAMHPRTARLREMLGGALSRIKPEMFCQTLYENLLGDFFGFLDVLYLGLPNRNHIAIGKLSRTTHIPLILTTNFDVNIEVALRQAGVAHELHVGRCPRKTLADLRKQSPTFRPVPLIKLHGSIAERSSIVITMRQAGHSLQQDLAETIRWALVSWPVLIVGYSGNDDDIFPEMLSVAREAREVYWVLWDKNSLTDNIKTFEKECPNCTLVGFGADSPPILVELADDGGGAIKNQPAGSVQNQAEYLRRWASDTAEHCWVNIFSELLIKTNCTEDAARVISEETDAIRQVNTDRWIAARSSANRGLAMARLKNYDGCVDSLFEAADIFMSLAHHREVIECLCHVVTETPLRPEWHGNSISVWCAEMSGRNYDPYQLGMYNLVAGIGFSELKDDRKMAFAERYFFVGAGYARKCGDSPLLIKCLEHLSQFFRSTNRPGEEEQCVAEVKRIKGLIGISQLKYNRSRRKHLEEMRRCCQTGYASKHFGRDCHCSSDNVGLRLVSDVVRVRSGSESTHLPYDLCCRCWHKDLECEKGLREIQTHRPGLR